MRKLACLALLGLLLFTSLPSVNAAPALAKGSYAQYSRLTTSPALGILNGTFRWNVQAVIRAPPVARILVINNQSSQILNFTFAIAIVSRIETPSYTVASQNPSATAPTVSADHSTKTFFWIDPETTIGSIIDTVLGSAYINGTAKIILHSGAVYNCWTAVSQTLGTTGTTVVNATTLFWYDQKTGLLVKLDSELSSGQFSQQSDTFLLQKTNINSLLSLPLTLSAVEWASLTMSVLSLILGGIAVAVAMDLRQFRRRKSYR